MAVISFLSDYGLDNSTVGIIKGTLLKGCPGATIVDLTHQIRPQDLLSARFELMTAYQGFPVETVHLAIVDPWEGVVRRPVAFRTAEHFFVGPDNGLFDGVLDFEAALEAVEIPCPPNISARRFRGRDIFAPAAAALAAGRLLSDLGRPIDPATLVRFEVSLASREPDGIHGQIQKVDHFGNLVTNIPGEWVIDQQWEVRVSGHRFSYSADGNAPSGGKLHARVASHGFLQLMFEGGNCAQRLGVGVGQLVVLQPREKAGK